MIAQTEVSQKTAANMEQLRFKGRGREITEGKGKVWREGTLLQNRKRNEFDDFN